MAQRIRRLTTDQEIPGSNPGWIDFFRWGSQTVRVPKCPGPPNVSNFSTARLLVKYQKIPFLGAENTIVDVTTK